MLQDASQKFTKAVALLTPGDAAAVGIDPGGTRVLEVGFGIPSVSQGPHVLPLLEVPTFPPRRLQPRMGNVVCVDDLDTVNLEFSSIKRPRMQTGWQLDAEVTQWITIIQGHAYAKHCKALRCRSRLRFAVLTRSNPECAGVHRGARVSQAEEGAGAGAGRQLGGTGRRVWR